MENLKKYSKLGHLDFDNIPPSKLNELKDTIKSCSLTHAYFTSPSGNGLKVFVITNNNQEYHSLMISQLLQFYKELTGFTADLKCSDLTRLCFVSWDPNAYYNSESEIFSPIYSDQNLIIIAKNNSETQLLEYCKEFTNIKSEFTTGNRNNHIYLFARNGNRLGINENDVIEYCLNEYDLNSFEIRSAVKSAYRNNVSEFAKFAKLTNDTVKTVKIAEFANFANSNPNNTISNDEIKTEEILSKTPFIPDEVFENLPKLLKECASMFKSKRERDVLLTSMLGILSGCLPNVNGEYGRRIVSPNLFVFILAPAANGKGSINSAFDLGNHYHSYLKDESILAKADFENKLENFQKRKVNNQTENDEKPIKPPFKILFIPANSSSSKIYHHLNENEGKGIICETEADTLGIMFNKEWSSYSDLLRKAFHHEKITQSRVTDNEYFEISAPEISVVLSGTPNQIFNIISSAEDGLFSRFIYYLFQSEQDWISQRPEKNGINLTDFFKEQSTRVFEMVQLLKISPTKMIFTEMQWDKKDELFSNYLDRINTISGKEAEGVIKRMGLIFFRICMILTAIRKFENRFDQEIIDCQDIDFSTACQLIQVYIEHSLIMFENLPKSSKHAITKLPTNIEQLFNKLPDNFKRKEAVALADSFGLSVKTVDNHLKKYKEDLFHSPKPGEYIKKVNFQNEVL